MRVAEVTNLQIANVNGFSLGCFVIHTWVLSTTPIKLLAALTVEWCVTMLWNNGDGKFDALSLETLASTSANPNIECRSTTIDIIVKLLTHQKNNEVYVHISTHKQA